MKSEIIKYMIVLSSFQIFLITYQTYQRSYSKLENLGIVYSIQKTPHLLVNTNSLTIHLQCCGRLKKSLTMSDPHYTIKQISSVLSKAARERRRNIISNKRKN
jgi:DNA-binding transcriptional regulator YhcF (GntR family)